MNRSRLRIRLVLVLLVAFVLQAAYGSALAIHEARPNLSLTTLLIVCLFADAPTGALLGFLMGLLEAAYTERYVGSFLVTRSLAGWAVGVLDETIFRDNLLVTLLTAPVGTLLVEGCFFLFAPQPHVLRWADRTLLQALYNGLLALPLYLVLRRIARRGQR